MTNSILNYFKWAIVQHSFVIASVWFLDVSLFTKYVLACILFTLCHIPNLLLLIITSIASIFIYLITLYALNNLEVYITIPIFLSICFVHALGGRYLISKGVEMRVLWMHPLFQNFFKKLFIKK